MNNKIDVTAPGKKQARGHLHPLTLVQQTATDIFSSMGFEIVDGPEMETEYYNFDALNIPADHPARAMHDTFWLKDKKLMRTHTSPVQIRYMKNLSAGGLPIRIIVPGRVFRYEATDATHEIQFYQLEGLMIGKKINLSNLKGVMEVFFQKFFNNKDIEVRLRPSYFPFVEPGVEVDMRRKNGKWIEIAGAGMVHPKVLENVGIDPREWQGFAFGMGIDRLAILKYKIDDIRLFYSSDLRFIKQF
ncbi:phenylalanine--tRNA ligase subunit alpha [Patescibacteria group bacterium]|nr:phenylalanine--tRNA ligase subunit alpha [Patescibacteria group bacterium]